MKWFPGRQHPRLALVQHTAASLRLHFELAVRDHEQARAARETTSHVAPAQQSEQADGQAVIAKKAPPAQVGRGILRRMKRTHAVGTKEGTGAVFFQ